MEGSIISLDKIKEDKKQSETGISFQKLKINLANHKLLECESAIAELTPLKEDAELELKT